MTSRTLLPLIEDDCTLPAGDIASRLEDWRTALSGAVLERPSAERVELALPSDTDVAALARLCGLEVGCCSFFSFALEISAGERRLVITTSAERTAALDGFADLLA